MDEQIFAVQEYGGISRMFTELAEQFTTDPTLGVDLHPIDAPVANHYLLDDQQLARTLGVRAAKGRYSALWYYFTQRRLKADVDLVHSTFYLPRGLGDYPGVPKVMTVHDMIPELLEKNRRRLDVLTMKRRYVAKVDHIICVSESTKSDLLRVYGDVETPISVVHHGVDAVFRPDVPPIPGFPEQYVVFVGNRTGYKDAAVLLRAFATLRGEFPELQVVFVGGGPFSGREIRAMDALGLAGLVRQVSLSESQMPSAYAQARMCVFSSQYEGFGLPALEAMACGTPLILANCSSLPEVGGDAARYFPPGDGNYLADEMRLVLTDDMERERLRTLGLARAREFSWQRSAKATADVYAQTIEAFSGR